MSESTLSLPTNGFVSFTLSGEDCIKFLQGQVTCNTDTLAEHYQATAICTIKGRVHFGLWIKKIADTEFHIVLSADCAESFSAHIKKYGAFSKISLSTPQAVFPYLHNSHPTFGTDGTLADPQAWAKQSIATGNFWIVTDTQELFQPQELRLHQRGGVNYDKGCYLGQEVIARMYFKSAPRAFLHRIAGTGTLPKAGEGIGSKGKVTVVNAIAIDPNTNNSTNDATTPEEKFEALVVARPELLAEFELLELPAELMKSVARNG